MPTTNKVQVDKSTTTAGTSTSTNYSYTYPKPKAEQGWECPRCGRINAPWVRSCDCSGNYKLTWIYDDSTKPWWYDYTVKCGEINNVNNPNIYQVGGSDYKEGNTYVNVSSTQTNKSNPDTKVTAWNTQTIHTGQTTF